MKPVFTRILTPFVALVISLTCQARAETDIVLAAQEAEVRVAPRAARLRLVNLPPLEFSLRAAYRCRGEIVSLTVSVADVAQTLRGETLTDQRATEVRLLVPARQIALLDSGAFCIAGDPGSADELQVAGFATAAASLRCINDDADSIRYASAPLTVRLTCTRGETQEPSVTPDDR